MPCNFGEICCVRKDEMQCNRVYAADRISVGLEGLKRKPNFVD
jgi:hypothetical protein